LVSIALGLGGQSQTASPALAQLSAVWGKTRRTQQSFFTPFCSSLHVLVFSYVLWSLSKGFKMIAYSLEVFRDVYILYRI
jgi:hypothetical protein